VDIDTFAAVAIMVILAGVVLLIWMRDLERMLRMGSEEARHEFVCDLCRSLRKDKGWKHDGMTWARGYVSLRLLPNGHFEMLLPFVAKEGEFTESQHTLVRAAIRVREEQA